MSMRDDNITRWGLFFPNEAVALNNIRQSTLKYNEEALLAEATAWFKSLDLNQIDILYVYGIGLGQYYIAAQEWLKGSESRRLIFLENDLESISQFLNTAHATQLLHDTQAWLQYFSPDSFSNTLWREFVLPFAAKNYHISCSKTYAETHADIFRQLSSTLNFWMNTDGQAIGEYLTYGASFFLNYYQNLFLLPQSYQASGLFGKFTGIPAIICGAGPSLDKNLSIVETLGNNAVIFAGGTAMNAVNSNGFCPHFGVGIDPNPAQWSRLIMNTAYEVPFLYRGRMNHDALDYVQGNTLYVTGAGGYTTPDWFERELGIASPESIDEGYNVINFSISLACALGCNPIILVGVDLAYTDKHSYQSGVSRHPIYGQKHDLVTKSSQDELIYYPDIYGALVPTLWKWVAESNWFTSFSISHPNTYLINSTEGGIGMEGVPNKPLAEMVKSFCSNQYALQVLLHGEIQNAQMPAGLTDEIIAIKVQEMRDSLLRAHNYCKQCEEMFSRFAENGSEMQDSTEIWNKLRSEIAFHYILENFNQVFERKDQWDLRQLDCDVTSPPHVVQAKRAKILATRFQHLRKCAQTNIEIIQLISNINQLKKAVTNKQEGVKALAEPISTCTYTFEAKTFAIVDPELNLNLHENYDSHPYNGQDGKMELRYGNGTVKFEEFHQQGSLHGPASYYSETSTLLARSWYVHGKQQGKSLFYYLPGTLYAIEQFYNGMRHGKQEYYYPDGQLKTILHYENGVLNGAVALYHNNGQIKRKQHFQMGIRQGLDRFWNAEGQLMVEAEYEQDKPVRGARQWHANGTLASEAIYDDNSQLASVKKWDMNGEEIAQETVLKEDFFDSITKQTGLFTDSLDSIYSNLRLLAPMLKPQRGLQDGDAFQKDLVELSRELEHLHKLNDELFFESGLSGDNLAESIWKTPTLRKEINKQLDNITQQLAGDLKKIQELANEIEKKEQDKKNHDKPL